MVKRYGALGGMPEITPHDLRRAFGTHLLKVTGNIRIVQQILGHSNVNTTQAYTAVTLSDMGEAMKRLNEGEGTVQKKGDPLTIEPAIGIIKPHPLEARLNIKTAPQPWNLEKLTPETMCCQDISIGIESSEIEIMSIEITNSDANVAYNLLRFVDEAPNEVGECIGQTTYNSCNSQQNNPHPNPSQPKVKKSGFFNLRIMNLRRIL